MNRRTLLTRGLVAGLGGLALGALGPRSFALAQYTGVCMNDDRSAALTEPNIEGPFYLPGAPTRNALAEDGRLLIEGRVTDTRCRPMADAVIEVWQANAQGEYDLRGMSFRGQLRTNADGRYAIRTVTPGRYLNGGTYRPAHIHVKVHATGRPPLTTQLYFPGDPYNDRDPWHRSSLQLAFRPMGCGAPRPWQPTYTRFDFVV